MFLLSKNIRMHFGSNFYGDVFCFVFSHFPIFKALVTHALRNIIRKPEELFLGHVVIHLTKNY